MMQALIVSNVLLFACVIALALVVLALARQVGLLHERVSPVGALMPAGGPAVGDEAPHLEVDALDGTRVQVAPVDADRSTLLFFLSPTCPVCKTLLPVLLSAAASEAPIPRVVFASDGDVEEHQRFIARHDLGAVPYLLSTEVGMAFGIGKLPYAVLIDDTGVIRAKGIVNTREHLESLFEAQRRGVASIQDYLAAEGEAA
jgi:methylamine dehydrogenase accessory protein MauD